MMVGVPGGGQIGSALGMPMMYQKLKNEKNVSMDKDKQEDESSIDVSSPRDNNSPIVSFLRVPRERITRIFFLNANHILLSFSSVSSRRWAIGKS